ncbi:MAG: class I SAM-dependent methyltransferase [Actinomycetota bacterium]
MATFQEYTDPRLVAVYDTLNPFAVDTAFYIELATELSASWIIDIGCGTGLLTCELARRGHQMIGVDPSGAMLDVARARPGGELVRWVEGDASRLDQSQVDLAIMTGHVAQVIADDDGWHQTLAAIHRALGPGGRVAFESRNPSARAWGAWTPQASRRQIDHPGLGPVEVWQQLLEVQSGRVSFEIHYHFASGEEVVSTNELRFRTQAELTRSLADVGFSVEHVFGDWDRQLVEVGSRELIFIATRE